MITVSALPFLVGRLLLFLFFGFSLGFAQGIITTVAGTDFVFADDGKQAKQAQLSGVTGVVGDDKGNIFVADQGNYQVVCISQDGTLTVVAGNGIPGYTGDGGPARSASLSAFSVGLDGAGNLYIAGTRVIRRVTPDGIITTVAGTTAYGNSGDGGPAAQATFGFISGMAVESGGSIYVSDGRFSRIRLVQPDGKIQAYAGDGRAAFGGDGGPAARASFNNQYGLALDSSGNLYVADTNNNRIRRITPDRIITTVAGGGNRLIDGGLGADTFLLVPIGVAVDSARNLYIAEASMIRKMGTDQIVQTFAGTSLSSFSGDGGPAKEAALNSPFSIAIDALGGLVIADFRNNRVRRVDKNGTIETIAGSGQTQFEGDNGPAVSASFGPGFGLALDPFHNIYVTDTANNRVRRIDAGGTVKTVAGTGDSGDTGDNGPATLARLYVPLELASDLSGNVYIAQGLDGPKRVRKLSPDGVITAATNSDLVGTPGIATDSDGNLFVLDSGACTIALVTKNGQFVRVAGIGPRCSFGSTDLKTDPASATSTPLPALDGSRIAVRNGSIYLTNPLLRKIYRITSDGFISKIAGNGSNGEPTNGSLATDAPLLSPTAITVDNAGNPVFGDSNFIRRIEADHTVTTVAGGGDVNDGIGDGRAATSARMHATAMQFDPSGNLFLIDSLSNRVRVILASPPQISSRPDTLEFNAWSGGAAPPPQNISVTSPVPGIGFIASASSDWLKLSVDAATTPRLIDLIVDPSNLAQGDYAGKITITAPTATPVSRDIAVTFHVAAPLPPQASLDKENFSFAFPKAGAPRSETLTVSNTGGGTLKFNVIAETTTGGAWLTANVATGTATPSASAAVTITANPGSLPPQTYRGVVRIIPAGSPEIRIPVNMTVSAVDTAIVLSQTGLTFTAVNGGGITPSRRFDVINIGRGTVASNIGTSTLTGGPDWLQVDRTDGTSTAGATPQGINVSVNASNLDPGAYYGSVQVTAPGAANNPQSVTVFLNVLASGSDPGAVTEPSELLFTTVAGGASPSSQNFFVYNIAAAPKGYRASASFDDPHIGTIAILPADATLDPARPNRVVVQPIVNSPGPGVYSGTVNLQFDDGLVRSVKVKLIVAASPPSASAQSRSARQATDGCIPKMLIPSFTSFAPSTVVTAGWPVPIEVNVKDDCGGIHKSGSVKVSFSTSDAPLSLRSLLDGRWAATWTVASGARAQATVQVEAKNPDLNISGKSAATLGLNQQQDQPSFTTSTISSAAGTPAFTPLAPGSLINIAGANLAEVAQDAGAPPLPFKLGNARVVIGGLVAPIVSVAQNQIQAVVPYGIGTNTTQQIIIQRGNTLSRAVQIDVAQAQPAIFTSGNGTQGQIYVVTGSDVRLVTADNPAKRGDTLVIECAGLGAVTPTPDDGAAQPISPVVTTASAVTVVFGTTEVTADSAGLKGGAVGRYQVRVKVPDAAPSGGDVSVQIKVAGQISPMVSLAIQ